MQITRIIKWLWPVYFLFLAFLFGCIFSGHIFIGLVCLGIAVIITCYYLLDIWELRRGMIAKRVRTVFTTVLWIGLILFAVTESLILYACIGSPQKDYQYVVVLGARVYGTSPSLQLMDRIEAAYTHLNENPELIAILSGGQGSDEGISEAACMFRELTAKGIPASRLWLEDQATSTWENLTYSLNLIEANTGTRPTVIGLLSSDYHLYRAGLIAQDCGIRARCIPANTSLFSLRLNNLIREAAGVWYYLLLGGQ